MKKINHCHYYRPVYYKPRKNYCKIKNFLKSNRLYYCQPEKSIKKLRYNKGTGLLPVLVPYRIRQYDDTGTTCVHKRENRG